jgi:alpha-L-arabinofuranosidase
MQGSCRVAVYMIDLERNSDIVKMASSAPLLDHFDLAEWSVSISASYNNVLLLDRSDQTT